MPRYRSSARRVRAYIHRSDDLADLTAAIWALLALRGAM